MAASPPGTRPPSIRPQHEGRDQGSPTPELLIREAHRVLAAHGVSMGPAKVVKLVRTFKHRVETNGFDFATYLMNEAARTADRRELRRVISYRDPTGEQAVRRVLKGCKPRARPRDDEARPRPTTGLSSSRRRSPTPTS
jgi:hypothetical protein